MNENHSYFFRSQNMARLWSGSCVYYVGEQQGPDATLMIYDDRLEVVEKKTPLYYSLESYEGGGTIKVPYTGLSISPRDANYVGVRTQGDCGALQFYQLESPGSVWKLVDFLIKKANGTLGDEQKAIWEKTRSTNRGGLLAVIENESRARIIKEIFGVDEAKAGLHLHYWQCSVVIGPLGVTNSPFKASVYCTDNCLFIDGKTEKKRAKVFMKNVQKMKMKKDKLVVKADKKKLYLSFEGTGREVRTGEMLSELVDVWLVSCSTGHSGGTKDRSKLPILRRLHLHFDSLDKKQDGTIKRNHFLRALKPLLRSGEFCTYIFNAFARDNDQSQITFLEFIQGFGDTLLGTVYDRLKFSFNLFDTNKCGLLGKQEFTQALQLFHSINPFNLPSKQSVEGLAEELFELQITNSDGLTLREYQDCLLHNTTLHEASETLLDFVVSNVDAVHSHQSPIKGIADKFILFGNPDWELASQILNGITKAVIEAHGSSDGSVMQTSLKKWLRQKSREKKQFCLDDSPAPVLSGCCGNSASGSKGRVQFIDYAPTIFRLLRDIFTIQKSDYLKSLGIELMVFNLIFGSLCTLKQMSSSGSSGSIFFKSHDERFIVKSLPNHEKNTLLRILPDYFAHMQHNPDTLMTRFCGLFDVIIDGTTVTLLSMENIFTPSPGIEIKQVYDLKGSTANRLVDAIEHQNVALKDLNLNSEVSLSWDWRQRLLGQLQKDTSFLESMGLIDYSFLLGFDSKRKGVDLKFQNATVNKALKILKTMEKMTNSISAKTRRDTNAQSSILEQMTNTVQIRKQSLVPQEVQTRRSPSVFKAHCGGVTTCDGSQLVFFGVIDFLTEYGMLKRIEHRSKRLFQGRMRMSCCPPDQYRSRFLSFLQLVFAKVTEGAPLIRLPRRIPEGGIYLAESEAGLLVHLIVSGMPSPTLFVITRTNGSDIPASTADVQKFNSGEVAVVRSRYAIHDVVFGVPLGLPSVSVIGSPNSGKSITAEPTSEVTVTFRGNRLHKTQTKFKVRDLRNKYNFLSKAVSLQGIQFSDLAICTGHISNEITCVNFAMKLLSNTRQPAIAICTVVSSTDESSSTQTLVNELSAELSCNYYLESCVTCQQAAVVVFVSYAHKGIVTEKRSGVCVDIQGTIPPQCQVLQMGCTTLCVIASMAVTTIQHFQKIVRSISRTLKLGGSILTHCNAIIWLKLDSDLGTDNEADTQDEVNSPRTHDGDQEFNPTELPGFRSIDGKTLVQYRNRHLQCLKPVFDTDEPALVQLSLQQEPVLNPFTDAIHQSGYQLVLRKLRLVGPNLDRWGGGVSLSVSADFLKSPVNPSKREEIKEIEWETTELLPLGYTCGKKISDFLHRRCLIFTLCKPEGCAKREYLWIYSQASQGSLGLGNLGVVSAFSVAMLRGGMLFFIIVIITFFFFFFFLYYKKKQHY